MFRSLKSMDFFGSKFSFTIDQSNKFRTELGAVLSLICIGLTGLFMFFFGNDFFYRANPRVLMKSVIPQEYFKVNLTNTNFLFPWRFCDVNSKPVQWQGIIYPVWTYLQYRLNNQNQLVKTLTKQINMQQCNSSYQYLMGGVNITDYMCPDWSEFPYELGGNTDGSFVDKIQLQLYYCPNGNTYSPSNNCTSLDTLDSKFNPALNNWYITYYYPQYLFTPENLSHPFTVFYHNYDFALSIGLSKTDRFYFQKPILNDDQGWIMSTNSTLETISILAHTSDFALFPRDKFYSTGQSSMFYRLVVYMDKTHDEINRSFMKFQELTAIVGGFMKGITSVSWFLSQVFNSYKKDQFLINQVFDFSSKSIIINKKPEKKLKENSDNISNSNIHLEKDVIQKNFLKLEIKSDQISYYQGKGGLDASLDKYFEEIRIKPKYEFGFIFTLKQILCKQDINPKSDLFKIIDDYLNHKLDICFYLDNSMVLERIRSIIFNSKQNLSLNFLRKFNPDLVEDKKIIIKTSNENKREILKEVIEYYSNLILHKNMSLIDENIFDSLETNVKNAITNLLNKSELNN